MHRFLVKFVVVFFLGGLASAADLVAGNVIYCPKYGVGQILRTDPLVVRFDLPKLLTQTMGEDQARNLQVKTDYLRWGGMNLREGQPWKNGRYKGQIKAVFSKSILISLYGARGGTMAIVDLSSPLLRVEILGRPTPSASGHANPKAELARIKKEKERLEQQDRDAARDDAVENLKTTAQENSQGRLYERLDLSKFKTEEALVSQIGWTLKFDRTAVIDLISDPIWDPRREEWPWIISDLLKPKVAGNIFVSEMNYDGKKSTSQTLTQLNTCRYQIDKYFVFLSGPKNIDLRR